jgi:hypothetical protein
MRSVNRLLCVAFTVVLLAAITGCGSNDGAPIQGGGDGIFVGKIIEYRGDGGGSAKPWPALIPGAPTDQTASMAPKLKLDQFPLGRAVPRRHISWFRVGQLTGATTVVVILQPMEDEDADLYVLHGSGDTYASGASLLGSSVRLPTDPGELGPGGYVPDWVAFDAGPTSKYPAAQVAVYGVNESPKKKRYRIQACQTANLPINGVGGSGTLSQITDHFYYLDAVSGTQYTVTLTASVGDPDIYVYGEEATDFINSSLLPGGGSVTFTATATGRHYVRVQAATSCVYTVSATSP